MYQADRFSNGGTVGSTDSAIDGVSEDTLYQSERYGTYKYEVPVTNASYSVQLHFAEQFQESSGTREFSVSIEGETFVQNLDLYAEVGDNKAYDIIIPAVSVSDESLSIELTSHVDNATIGGFAIYSDSNGEFVEPPEPEPGETCDLPTNLSWTSTESIINPKNGAASIKDPSIVYFDGNYHVFATTYSGGYKSMYTKFSDFGQAKSASHSIFSPGGSSTVAPQVLYFSPQDKWYIITQWPAKFSTNSDINNPNGWTRPETFWPGNDEFGGALDYWVICDDAECYMFFFKDDGNMYQVKTSVANFPNFNVNEVTISNVEGAGGQSILFEAGNVYKVQGTDEYLLVVEGWGASEGRRLYRGWTSTSLNGPWKQYKTSENDPFAGLNNVSFPSGQWSQQISHGELVRAGHDEKMEINACNMQFLYQGVDLGGFSGSYDERPYKLGLLNAN